MNLKIALVILVESSLLFSAPLSPLVTQGITHPPPVVPEKQYLATFYYPWWTTMYRDGTWGHWKDGNANHNPPLTWSSDFSPDPTPKGYSSIFDPLAALYSSFDPLVILRHSESMEEAGIEVSISSWWGTNSIEDHAFSNILSVMDQQPANHTLKWAIYYEPESYSDPPVDALVSDLEYILSKYGTSPHYLKVNGVPVVFVFGVETNGLDYATRWRDSRDSLYAKGKPVFVNLKVFEGFRLCCADFVDGWHQYVPALRKELQEPYSAFVSPGYEEFPELASARGGGVRPSLSRDPFSFDLAVKWLRSLTYSDAKFLLIETFNEWHEGSQIEPGIPIIHDESGFVPAGPSYGYTYLDAIARQFGPQTREDLQSKVARLENDVEDLQSRINNLQNSLNNASTSLADLNNSLQFWQVSTYGLLASSVMIGVISGVYVIRIKSVRKVASGQRAT